MASRVEQKEKRKQDILFAGLDLFVTKGYAATKIIDIAKKVEMSTGLLFHYFDSKEKLYIELVKMGLQGTMFPIEKNYDCAIMYFEQFTKQLFAIMKTQPYVAKMFVLMAQAQRSEGTPEVVRNIALQVDTINQFVPIVKQGQKDGSIRLGDALALSNAFWCSIQGISQQYAAHPEIELPNPEWIIDIVRGGIDK